MREMVFRMAFGFIVVVDPKNQLIEKADAGEYL
jgi:hypothetical protein